MAQKVQHKGADAGAAAPHPRRSNITKETPWAFLFASLFVLSIFGYQQTTPRPDPFTTTPGLWTWLAYPGPDPALQAMPVVPAGAFGRLVRKPLNTDWINSPEVPAAAGMTVEGQDAAKLSGVLGPRLNDPTPVATNITGPFAAIANLNLTAIRDAVCSLDGRTCAATGLFGTAVMRETDSSGRKFFIAKEPALAAFLADVGGSLVTTVTSLRNTYTISDSGLALKDTENIADAKGALDVADGSAWPYTKSPDNGSRLFARRVLDPAPGQRAAMNLGDSGEPVFTASGDVFQRGKRGGAEQAFVTQITTSGSTDPEMADLPGSGNLNALILDNITNIDWVVGDGGAIFRRGPAPGLASGGTPILSYNDGSVVQRIPSATTANLRSIFFQDATTGWIASGWNRDNSDPTGRPVVLQTTDGGATWRTLSYAATRPPWFLYGALPALILSLLPLIRIWRDMLTARQSAGITGAAEADQPIGWDDPDVLGIKPLALAMDRFMRNTATRPPLTIAVEGEWGTGKSSLMNLVRQRLEASGHRPVWFNAWHHQNDEQLFAALFENIRTQARPPFWMLSGLVFGLRLLWIRAGRNLIGLLVFSLALILTVMFLQNLLPRMWEALSGETARVWAFLTDKTQDNLVVQIIAAAGGLGALGLAIKGVLQLLVPLQALNANPAALLATLSGKARMADYSDKLSFQYRFGREFADVCHAMRSRSGAGLVIFIDDLDRCNEDQVMRVLEAVNFLATSGECFIILGMDRARVLERVNQAVKEDKNAAYAGKYLEKLFNLTVRVPKLERDGSLKLLTGEPEERETQDKTKKPSRAPALIRKAVRFTAEIAPFPILLVAAAIFVHTHFLPVETGIPAVVTVTGTSTPDTPTGTTPTTITTTTPSQDDESKLLNHVKVDSLAPLPAWSPWVIPALFAFIAFLLSMRRQVLKAEEQVEDSREFVTALRLWHEAAYEADPTPRAIKRYQNRLRFQAMRLRPEQEKPDWLDRQFSIETPMPLPANISDAALVALGTAEAVAGSLPPRWRAGKFAVAGAAATEEERKFANFTTRYAAIATVTPKDIVTYRGLAKTVD